VERGDEFRFHFIRSHCFVAILLAAVLLFGVVVCCMRLFRFSVGRCFVRFVSFRGLLRSSESKFFFELEFVVKDYFKINLSYVRV